MTAEAQPAPNVRAADSVVDFERLHVASQAVLDWVSNLAKEGRGGSHLDQLTHHAQVLVDTRGAPRTPFAATRTHALMVRNELVLLDTERSLTMAVWFDDALGLHALSGRSVPTDPAEHG